MLNLLLLPMLTVMLPQAAQKPELSWPARYTKALERLSAAPDEIHRFFALPDVAKAAFETHRPDEARKFAHELLELAGRHQDLWNYGNAVHDGHMVLGRIAPQEGDAATAERELLEAGKTPGSPQLNSFGPNMSLAKDLIKQKRTDAVVEYFDLCSKFWKLERGRLRRWTVLARGGEMPDFGANLFY